MTDELKNTEIGLLPKDWKLLTLREIGELKNGINKGKEDFGHGYPMVNLNDVFGVSSINGKNLGLVNSTVKEQQDYSLKRGDVLFIRSSVKPSGVGLTALVPIDMPYTVYSGFIIRFRDDGFLNNDFKKHCFYNEGFRNRLLAKSTVSANTNINQQALATLTLGVPPLPEQQKIADILCTVDEKIDLIDQQITETQELKKGLMQRLLTKGIGHTEFKDSPLGKIPKSWEILELVKHIKLLSGFAFKSKGFNEEGKGTKLLRGINITVGKLRWNEKLDRWWNLPFDDFDKYSAKVGDLVISMDGSLVGRNYARVQEQDLPLLIVQRVACLRAKSTLDLEYLNQIIGSPLWLNYVDAVKTSSGIPHISAKDIREFKIPFPSLLEQQKIANILSSVDDKLQVLSDKKSTYEELKQGLMQQLLTGKVRVKV